MWPNSHNFNFSVSYKCMPNSYMYAGFIFKLNKVETIFNKIQSSVCSLENRKKLKIYLVSSLELIKVRVYYLPTHVMAPEQPSLFQASLTSQQTVSFTCLLRKQRPSVTLYLLPWRSEAMVIPLLPNRPPGSCAVYSRQSPQTFLFSGS